MPILEHFNNLKCSNRVTFLFCRKIVRTTLFEHLYVQSFAFISSLRTYCHIFWVYCIKKKCTGNTVSTQKKISSKSGNQADKIVKNVLILAVDFFGSLFVNSPSWLLIT